MKRSSPEQIYITLQPSFCVVIVVALIVLPIRWVLGWLFSVVVHELGHVVGIKMFKIRINSVSVQCSGIYISTAQMHLFQEIVVAIMGPVFSLLTLLLVRWLPYAVVCGLIQFTFNMLPIDGLDGGRVLFAVLELFLPTDRARRWMKRIQMLSIFAAIYLGLRWHWGILVMLGIGILLLRTGCITFPCKRKKQIVQWSK